MSSTFVPGSLASPTASRTRSASDGRPAPASMLARRAITTARASGSTDALARRLVRGQRTRQVTGAIEARLGATASELDDLVVGERPIPHLVR